MLATWVGARDGLAIGQVVEPVDAVDEDHAGRGVGVGRPHDPLPQLARRQALMRNAVEFQLPRHVLADCLHEGVGNQHRQVEHAQPPRFALGLNECLDVGVVAGQHPHHGAAPRPGAHDGAAHGVPHVHEAERSRGVGADTLDQCAPRPERGEVVADAAALLHGQRRFLQVLEDAGHVIGDVAHDETVEQRHPAISPGAGQDAAGGQETEVLHGLEEALLPRAGILFRSGQGARHPAPTVGHGLVHGPAVGALEAVLHLPDLLGYMGRLGHLKIPHAVPGDTAITGSPGTVRR